MLQLMSQGDAEVGSFADLTKWWVGNDLLTLSIPRIYLSGGMQRLRTTNLLPLKRFRTTKRPTCQYTMLFRKSALGILFEILRFIVNR